jgi:hypothetical protein
MAFRIFVVFNTATFRLNSDRDDSIGQLRCWYNSQVLWKSCRIGHVLSHWQHSFCGGNHIKESGYAPRSAPLLASRWPSRDFDYELVARAVLQIIKY